MRHRVLLSVSVCGLAALIYCLSRDHSPVPSNVERTEIANLARPNSPSASPIPSPGSDIDRLNYLLQTDPAKALAFLEKLEEEKRRNPPPEFPEAAGLTDGDQKLFNSEVGALASIFQRFEKESSQVVFEGPHNEVIVRSIRINAPTQEQLDQVASAYSAVLRKYPEDSKLHTTLWEWITQMMHNYSTERMVLFSRPKDGHGPWANCREVRSTLPGRDVSAVTTGVPNASGGFTFDGPSRVTMQSLDDPSQAGGLFRFSHLLDP